MITRMFTAVACLLCALTLMRFEAVRAADEPLLLVVGTAFPLNNIEMATVKTLFRGGAATVAGKRLIPINHPAQAPLRVAFDRAVLGLEPAAVGRFWIDRRIRDEGTPPTTASSPELAMRIVASLPHAISYATKAMLNPKIKALTLDGKAAGQPGYPLPR